MAGKKNIIPITITAIFLIIALYSFIDDILYTISKRVTVAHITKLEKLPVANPYKVYLTYYNEYNNSMEKTYIESVNTDYGDKLKVSGKKSIYYRKYYPNEVYFVDYKSPNYGQLFLSFGFFVLMLGGLIVLFKDPRYNSIR